MMNFNCQSNSVLVASYCTAARAFASRGGVLVAPMAEKFWLSRTVLLSCPLLHGEGRVFRPRCKEDTYVLYQECAWLGEDTAADHRYGGSRLTQSSFPPFGRAHSSKDWRSIDIAFERIVVEKLAAPQIAAINLAQFGFIANGTPQSGDRRDLMVDQIPGIPVAQQEIRR